MVKVVFAFVCALLCDFRCASVMEVLLLQQHF